MNKKNILVLIAKNYPFGYGEPFLEAELRQIHKHFDKIFIISKNIIDEKTKFLPSNASVLRYQKASSTFEKVLIPLLVILNIHLFIRHFFFEITTIKGCYGKSIKAKYLSDIFHTMIKGIQLRNFILRNIPVNKDSTYFFYSYWLDTESYSLCLLKRKYPQHVYISRAHSGEIYFERSKTKYIPFKKLVLEKLDRTFFISEHGRNYLSHLTKTSPNSYSVSRLGIVNAIETNLSPVKDIHLLSCSRIISLKRIDLIIDSLALIDDITIEWHHVGSGELSDEIQEYAHKNLAHKKNISYTFTGQIKSSELLDYYRSQDFNLFINLSTNEGIPVSIMEAYSMGMPAIATNVGGVGEIVNERNGYLIPVDSVPNFVAEKIIHYYHRSDRKSVQLEAIKTWKEIYNADVNYEEFIRSVFRIKDLQG